ncbi:hypothetical protein GCM10009845_04830 [Pedococcus bigeumensis]
MSGGETCTPVCIHNIVVWMVWVSGGGGNPSTDPGQAIGLPALGRQADDAASAPPPSGGGTGDWLT